MDLTTLIVLLIVLMAAIAMIVVFLTVGSSGESQGFRQQLAVSDSLRSMVSAQRERDASNALKGTRSSRDRTTNLALAAAAESGLGEKQNKATSYSSKISLQKKLKYAKWRISPVQFRTIQILASLVFLASTWVLNDRMVWALSLWGGATFVSWLLGRAIKKRFKLFDEDYPVLLLQYVSLLKTGMNTMTGLEAAAKGLDEGSLVRAEVELLVERLRLGLTEDQAINAFGEDIAHPELELFVQSLLLSKRVGGTLSTTLERLARQVRKRQQFREQAIAAVGMERGSIYAIAVIMTLLLFYIGFTQPALVVPAFTHEFGSQMIRKGLMVIILGFYWSNKVTNIKV